MTDAIRCVGLPAEEAYRAAVADMNGALMGNNIEAARGEPFSEPPAAAAALQAPASPPGPE